MSVRKRPPTTTINMHSWIGTRWLVKSAYNLLSHSILYHSIVAPLQILKQNKGLLYRTLLYTLPIRPNTKLDFCSNVLDLNGWMDGWMFCILNPPFIIKERNKGREKVLPLAPLGLPVLMHHPKVCDFPHPYFLKAGKFNSPSTGQCDDRPEYHTVNCIKSLH